MRRLGMGIAAVSMLALGTACGNDPQSGDPTGATSGIPPVTTTPTSADDMDDGSVSKLDVEGATGMADDGGSMDCDPVTPNATLTGTVYAPNLEIPISGAVVYVTSGDAEPIPDGVYCAECVEIACNEHFVLTNPDGTPMNDAQIVAAFRKDWSPKHNLDTQSVSWNTKDDRWEIKIQSKTKQKGAEPTFFLRVTAGTATPMFEQLKGGFVYLGAATEEDTWTVTAPKVADDHVEIKLGPKPKEVQVTDRNSGEPTFVGKTKLEGGKGQTFKVPIKIRFGDAEVEVRSSKPPHDIKFVCTRHHVDRRRTLRTFDASKKHKDRSLVKPKVGNPDHYGTS